MKNATFLVVAILAAGFLHAQVSISDTVSISSGKFDSKKYERIITRQSSCSVYMSNFDLTLSEPGTFVAEIKVTFLGEQGTSNDTKIISSTHILLDDLIECKVSKQQYTYHINNVKIVDNQVLTDVSDIHVQINLVPVKEESRALFNVLSPFLNSIVPLGSSISEVLTLAIDDARDKNNKTVVVFATTIQVASNLLEFERISANRSSIVLRNNHHLGMVFAGSKSHSFKPNIVGATGNFLNAISQFVCNEVVFEDEVMYDGIADLELTKDKNAIFPGPLFDALFSLDQLLTRPDIVSIENDINADVKKVNDLATKHQANRDISQTELFSVSMYTQLATLYKDYQKILLAEGKLTNAWLTRYNNFMSTISTKGSANGIVGLGVTGIYNDKMAVVYVPYSLPDDFILSMYTWQLAIHGTLNDTQNYTHTKPLIFKPQ